MYEGINVPVIAEEDAACVRSILAGRPERFRELVERYQDRIFATLSRYEHDRGRVEDMAQDVFVKAWRHLKKFDPLKAPFENWLSRMATNAARYGNTVLDDAIGWGDQLIIKLLRECGAKTREELESSTEQ